MIEAAPPPASSPSPGTHPEALGRAILPPGSPALLALLERRPARMLRDVGMYWALIGGAFALVAFRPAPWAIALAFVVIGNSQYALSILTHEGNHATLFRRRATNDLFCRWVLCAPLGVDFEGERENHLEHHRLFASERDPDRYLYRLADKNSKLRLLLFLTGLTSMPHILEKARRKRATEAARAIEVNAVNGNAVSDNAVNGNAVNGNAAQGDGPSARSAPGFLSRGRRPTLLAQVAIFALIWRFFPPYAYVALWLAPLYVMAFVPHKVRMFCEHAQLTLPDAAADGRRLLTFRPTFVETQLIAPIGLSMHAEHHMFPAVPYYDLPRVSPLIEATPGVEIRSSYLGFLFACFRRVPLVAAG